VGNVGDREIELCCNSRMSSRTRRRSFASRFDKGSSKSSTCGSNTRARATARAAAASGKFRRRAIFEAGQTHQIQFSPGRVPALSSWVRPARSVHRRRSPEPTYVGRERRTEHHADIALARGLESHVVAPIKTRPSVATSRPAIRRSVVVLPQPDGPSSVTSVPGAIVNETSSTAVTAHSASSPREILRRLGRSVS